MTNINEQWLRRVIEQAPAYSTVEIPAGVVIRLKEPLSIQRPLALLGVGAVLEVGPEDDAPYSAIQIEADGVRIVGLELRWRPWAGDEAPESVVRGARAIHARGVSQVWLEDVEIVDAPVGINLVECSRASIVSCGMRSRRINLDRRPRAVNYSAAIRIIGSERVTVQDCGLVGHGQGVLVGHSGPIPSRRMLIDGCDLHGQGDCGIYISSGEHVVIRECHAERWSSSAYKICGQHHRLRDCSAYSPRSTPQRTAVVVSGSGAADGRTQRCRTVVSGLVAQGHLRRGVYAAPRDGAWPDEVILRDCDLSTSYSASHTVGVEHDPMRTILTMSGVRTSGFASSAMRLEGEP